MYKAIKENKIIAINERGNFPCLIYDEVEEDTEHQVSDYEHYKGEFLLKEDVPAPSDEEIRQMRIQYRREHIDDQTAERSRKMANGTWTDEDEQAYLALDAEVTAYIEEHYPYNVDNTENIDYNNAELTL